MTPEPVTRSFAARVVPEPVKVTAEMLNAVAPRAVEIMEKDLRDFASMHRNDHTVYATIETQKDAILKATTLAVNRIIRDPNLALPETCEDLATRLRAPQNLNVMHFALREANCGAFYTDAVKENFGKLMRMVAKETEQACNQRESVGR